MIMIFYGIIYTERWRNLTVKLIICGHTKTQGSFFIFLFFYLIFLLYIAKINVDRRMHVPHLINAIKRRLIQIHYRWPDQTSKDLRTDKPPDGRPGRPHTHVIELVSSPEILPLPVTSRWLTPWLGVTLLRWRDVIGLSLGSRILWFDFSPIQGFWTIHI